MHEGTYPLYRVDVEERVVFTQGQWQPQGRWVVALEFEYTTFAGPNTFRNIEAIETTSEGKILTWSRIGGISGPSHALSLYNEVSCELLMRCETSVSFMSFALTSVGNNNSILYGVQGGPEEV